MMLRFLYHCVLRLHPPGFRERFGGEMSSILDQTSGKGAEFKLLVDAFLSLARQWTLRHEFWYDLAAGEEFPSDDIPVFRTLDPFRPRIAAMMHGIVLSLALFSATCFAIRYSWIHLLHVHIPEVQSQPESQDERESRTKITPRAHGDSAEFPQSTSEGNTERRQATPLRAEGNAIGAQPTAVRTAAAGSMTQRSRARAGFVNENNPGRRGQPLLSSVEAPTNAQMSLESKHPPDQNSAMTVPAADGVGAALDAVARHRVIKGAVSNLEEHYVDTATAREMAISLRVHEKNGDDRSATDGDTLARLLTTQLRAVNPDKRLAVIYSQDALLAHRGPPTPEQLAQYRKTMREQNCDFERVQMLAGNIGYLKLNSFPDLSICGSTAASAMASLNRAGAIIFDLRDNGGGQPEMVAQIAAYLFDHPEYWYSPRENTSRQSWTHSPVPGNRLADKPVYVLTSHSTYSGAEQFCYDLKMLKRATLIGETTGGAAHAGVFYRIDNHFGIAIPETHPINPYATPDWEETGVEPDVKVNAADSLKTAISLAASRLQTRR